MRTHLAFSSLVTLLVPTLALAQATWSRESNLGSFYLGDVSVAGDRMFIAGIEVVQSGFSITLKPKAFRSDDGGRTLDDVSGPIDDSGSLDAEVAAFALDPQRAWIGGAKRIWRTTDGGDTWTAASVPSSVATIHFFGPEIGVAAGARGATFRTTDGGATWTQVTSNTSSTLRRFFFLDATQGWAIGFDEDDETTTPSNGVVLRTTDAGASWSVVATFADRALTTIGFLCDGKTGWLSGWAKTGEDQFEARLWKTTDGGATWADANLPLQVGTMQAFGSQPIKLARVHAAWWDDAGRGHLVGSALLGKSGQSSSGGGGGSNQSTYLWRLVDYVTTDGGATWAKTDLGSIPFSPFNPPPSDGTMMAGAFLDFHTGVLVGTASAVFTTKATCSTDAACADGYTCVDGACTFEGPRCPLVCGEGEVDEGGVCVPTGDGPDAGTGDGGGEGDPDDAPTGGCGCGTGLETGALALLCLVLRRPRLRIG